MISFIILLSASSSLWPPDACCQLVLAVCPFLDQVTGWSDGLIKGRGGVGSGGGGGGVDQEEEEEEFIQTETYKRRELCWAQRLAPSSPAPRPLSGVGVQDGVRVCVC